MVIKKSDAETTVLIAFSNVHIPPLWLWSTEHEEKRAMPAFKGGYWQKNVLLNQIGGDECIMDTKPRARGSKLMDKTELKEEGEAPVPEYHFTRWPPTLGEIGWKIVASVKLAPVKFAFSNLARFK